MKKREKLSIVLAFVAMCVVVGMMIYTKMPTFAWLSILGLSLFFSSIAYLLIKWEEKRSKNMKLYLGEEVVFHTTKPCKCKVLEDNDDTVKIEIETSRYNIHKK